MLYLLMVVLYGEIKPVEQWGDTFTLTHFYYKVNPVTITQMGVITKTVDSASYWDGIENPVWPWDCRLVTRRELEERKAIEDSIYHFKAAVEDSIQIVKDLRVREFENRVMKLERRIEDLYYIHMELIELLVNLRAQLRMEMKSFIEKEILLMSGKKVK